MEATPHQVEDQVYRGNRDNQGLEDDRVSIIEDRGRATFEADNKHLFQAQGRVKKERWVPPKDKSALEAIGQELDKAWVVRNGRAVGNKSWGAPSKFFRNRDIYKIMTLEKIEAAIQETPNLKKSKFTASDILYGSKKTPPCLKLFSLLILMELSDKLLPLMESGVSDRCLPVWGHKERGAIVCTCSKKEHFPKSQGISCLINAISKMSYQISSPYIRSTPEKHPHFILHKEDELPFETRTLLKDEQTTTSQFDPKTKARLPGGGAGGFAEVFVVEIDESQCNFKALGIREGTKKFAVKTLFEGNRVNFNRELASLLPFRCSRHLQIIQVLATFEVKEDENNSKFSFLFPYAQGNLWSLFKLHEFNNACRNAPWVAEQCFQLATAVAVIHNERINTLRNDPELYDDNELFGRHGDIKGDNILYFQADDDIRLVIADFGLGRLHTKVSRSVQNPHGIDNSSTYRAPEFDVDKGQISRKSDNFSLGCVFLEIVTWLLEGYTKVHDTFPMKRLEVGKHNKIQEYTFFKAKIDEQSNIVAEPKQKVSGWIMRLREHRDASSYTDQFLDFIQNHMLTINPKERADSGKVRKELWKLREGCKVDSFNRPHSQQVNDGMF